MKLQRILDPTTPEFMQAYEIYRTSFPIFEQRNLQDQISALGHNYVHPSYQKGTTPHTLKIMSEPKIDDDLFKEFKAYVYNQVLQFAST
ncbi:MAG: hypothetical protein ATN35_05605 [Epulopiscium sp. Nele67-Bin004]|nr:MAG: hypothetical protein ATN35_05605 [Epulopiscium sp. Nele67-Bin004]